MHIDNALKIWQSQASFLQLARVVIGEHALFTIDVELVVQKSRFRFNATRACFHHVPFVFSL